MSHKRVYESWRRAMAKSGFWLTSPRISLRSCGRRLERSVEDPYPRPEALIGTGRSGMHGWQRIRIDVRRPKAIECDEVAVMPMHAGDAMIFVPARAIRGGNLMGI